MDKKLELIIQPRVIDHLGIKMYQKPVDVISEFIANAWDADAENVSVDIDGDHILIADDGHGMTYDECQNNFLTVGRNRRLETKSDKSKNKKRPVLGRKGIGKFAGFGIAQKIEVRTTSSENGEATTFSMDISKILDADAAGVDNKIIDVLQYNDPSPENVSKHGTSILLSGITAIPEVDTFMQDLSRRFLLVKSNGGDFSVKVNDKLLPEPFADAVEFLFPRDFTDEEKKKILGLQSIDDAGWCIESLCGNEIKWRIGFFEEPIDTEELRGIAVFSRGKMSQKPFFFDIAGGISGQHGLEYMTGQVVMDFIDDDGNDLIATERQRINLQTKLGQIIKKWGIERIKFLSSAWKSRRSEKRQRELEDRLTGFKDRLDNLPSTERNTVKSVLLKIASFERLGKVRYQEWCNDILTSWEKGRLKDIIQKMASEPNLDQDKFLDILAEADVLTALNIAESIKTKIVTIGELKQRVESGQLENKVRDFIFENPWLIHPKWESFQKERRLEKLIHDMGVQHLNEEIFSGRVDLTLSAGSDMLLLEFMRPGLSIDQTHLDRINYYVMGIRNALAAETGNEIKTMTDAYVIADAKSDSDLMRARANQLAKENIWVITWDTLIANAIKQWQEHLDLLKSRHTSDARIQNL